MSRPFISAFDPGHTRASRRSFLITTTSLAAAALWADRAVGVTRTNVALADHPFQLGVASGDPAPDGFVIWTRLAPKPLEGGGMPADPVEVAWQVAEDEGMTKIVREGKTIASPDFAHSVHVEVEGLRPAREYFYQFKAAGDTSPKGRTRTAPAADVMADKLRFAFASCQHWEAGLFTAYEHMLKEDLDLVVHLGDYIYEGQGKDGGVRKHVGPYLKSIEDYRNRHAQYKTDAHLQAMHAAAPWIVAWDDHEVQNNYANDISQNNDPREAFLEQRARAYQAYYEHMPLRRAALPKGPEMQLYRRLGYGQLADFFVLDTRQYRSDQPCGDGNKPACPEAYDANRTLLGEKQRTWLFDQVNKPTGKWNVLAQQVMMARADRTSGEGITFSMDQWPGYEADRRRVLKYLHEHKTRNAVVLTGDIHSNWANELLVDFDDLGGKPVAVEFVGTSISSGGDGTAFPKSQATLLEENPFVKFYNAERGYVRCDVTPREWRTDYRGVEYVSKPGAPLVTRASFVVEDGQPKLNKV